MFGSFISAVSMSAPEMVRFSVTRLRCAMIGFSLSPGVGAWDSSSSTPPVKNRTGWPVNTMRFMFTSNPVRGIAWRQNMATRTPNGAMREVRVGRAAEPRTARKTPVPDTKPAPWGNTSWRRSTILSDVIPVTPVSTRMRAILMYPGVVGGSGRTPGYGAATPST